MMPKTHLNIAFVLACLLVGSQILVKAQDLEPRFLSAIPIGGNFAVASYGYSTGNILLDNTLPIEDLNANLNNVVLAYARSFRLLNKLTKIDAVVPYSIGKFEGMVAGIDSSTSRIGLGDPMLRISMVILGTQALSPVEFVKHHPKKFNLGASVRMRLPLGQYNPTKLINLGANRWAFKFALAGSYDINRKIVLEAHLACWMFTQNNEFFNGNVLRQKPMVSAQIHAAYIFKPGIWLAISVGRGGLGETLLNGIEKNDNQNNSRFGTAFAYRLSNHHSLKIAFTSGLSTRYGANFTTLLIAYQFMWFDKKFFKS